MLTKTWARKMKKRKKQMGQVENKLKSNHFNNYIKYQLTKQFNEKEEIVRMSKKQDTITCSLHKLKVKGRGMIDQANLRKLVFISSRKMNFKSRMSED